MILRTLFVLALFWYAFPVAAATLYIDPANPNLNRGDAVTLAVRLDTDEAAGECINAIDGVITYNDAINPVDISVGQSILPVWVEFPVINRDTRTITFAGGIPNGYCGRVEGDPRLTNTILEIVFRAPGLSVGGSGDNTTGQVSFAPETRAYLNDGFGTEATLATLGATLNLAPTVGAEIVDEWRDEVVADELPPEEFSISLERGEIEFGGQYYIVFNTTDKQSGMSHYEVIEELPEDARLFNFGAATAPWIETRSPYILKDQSLRSIIRVRAIDKAGNEYVATLQPQNAEATDWLSLMIIAGGVLLVLLILLGIFFLVRRRRPQEPLEESVVISHEDQK